MEKVKVNKELFELLEYYNLKEENDDVFLTVVKKVINGKVFKGERNLILNNINPRMFLDCIYYGYELEETKEEKLQRIYKTHDNHYAYGAGIKKAVEILGLEIEGINK